MGEELQEKDGPKEIMRKCKKCGRYTFSDKCPICGEKTASPHPPRYVSIRRLERA